MIELPPDIKRIFGPVINSTNADSHTIYRAYMDKGYYSVIIKIKDDFEIDLIGIKNLTLETFSNIKTFKANFYEDEGLYVEIYALYEYERQYCLA
jgi:hypothetical protein